MRLGHIEPISGKQDDRNFRLRCAHRAGRRRPPDVATVQGSPSSREPTKNARGVVAQVWRGGTGRQARLAAALQAIEVVPLDAELGRNAGVLTAGSGHADAIDAALVALADHGDQIITSDPGDLSILAASSNRRINIVPV